MKLADITIYKHNEIFLSPFARKTQPSVQTKSYLLKLLNDQYFNDCLTKLRKKFKIPTNGYPSTPVDNIVPGSITDVDERQMYSQIFISKFV